MDRAGRFLMEIERAIEDIERDDFHHKEGNEDDADLMLMRARDRICSIMRKYGLCRGKDGTDRKT